MKLRVANRVVDCGVVPPRLPRNGISNGPAKRAFDPARIVITTFYLANCARPKHANSKSSVMRDSFCQQTHLRDLSRVIQFCRLKGTKLLRVYFQEAAAEKYNVIDFGAPYSAIMRFHSKSV
jgi:hypothetical protein